MLYASAYLRRASRFIGAYPSRLAFDSHNEDIIRTLDIHDHDMLYVEKGGEIIPKITDVDNTSFEASTPSRMRFTVRGPMPGSIFMASACTSSVRSDLLAGKTIVISGTFSKHSRDEYKELIENNGGKNSGSISKKTDYVLAGENMGPAKLEKAKSLDVPLMTMVLPARRSDRSASTFSGTDMLTPASFSRLTSM